MLSFHIFDKDFFPNGDISPNLLVTLAATAELSPIVTADI
jgi:hypothetical protein